MEFEIDGNAQGISGLIGELNVALTADGVTISESLVSGGMNVAVLAAGSSTGTSDSSTYLMIKFGAAGSADGTSAATGAMNIALVAFGTSSGVSSASGHVEEGLQINLDYVGTQELGIDAPQGSKFKILITGSFSTLSIAINGKTLSYTDDVDGETIVIDNIDMTVKKDGANALGNLSGDIDSFLKLIPGDNLVTITKIGGACSALFDFSPMWI